MSSEENLSISQDIKIEQIPSIQKSPHEINIDSQTYQKLQNTLDESIKSSQKQNQQETQDDYQEENNEQEDYDDEIEEQISQNQDDYANDTGGNAIYNPLAPKCKVSLDDEEIQFETNNQISYTHQGKGTQDEQIINSIKKRKTSGNSSTKKRSYSRSRSVSEHRSRSRSPKKHILDKDQEAEVMTEKKDKITLCDRCRRNEKSRKTCICIVPATQRRAQIGSSGCQTCGCKGCSVEDFEQREQQKKQKNERKKSRYSDSESDSNFKVRNGCCKKCLKAFSANGKACICQVPAKVRRQPLPPEGCKFCSCHGCNPEDTRKHSPPRKEKYSQKQQSSSRRNRSLTPSDQSESEEELDVTQLNFNNFDKSSIGLLISSQLNLFPPLIGFGIPQRTASYILGKQKNQQDN